MSSHSKKKPSSRFTHEQEEIPIKEGKLPIKVPRGRLKSTGRQQEMKSTLSHQIKGGWEGRWSTRVGRGNGAVLKTMWKILSPSPSSSPSPRKHSEKQIPVWTMEIRISSKRSTRTRNIFQ